MYFRKNITLGYFILFLLGRVILNHTVERDYKRMLYRKDQDDGLISSKLDPDFSDLKMNPPDKFNTNRLQVLYSKMTNSKEQGSCSRCGLTNREGTQRLIIGGKPVAPSYKYPWMISLETKNGIKVCGGAIISEEYILTAAHCLFARIYENLKSKDENMTMLQETSNLSYLALSKEHFVKPENIQVAFVTSSYETRPRFPVSKVIPHEDYSARNFMHDIALLKLKRKIKCDKFAIPICLPKPDFIPKKGETNYISGWGFSNIVSTEVTVKLKEAQLIHTPEFQDCVKHSSGIEELQNTTFCLFGAKNQTACSGDSGGSMFQSIDNKFYTIGVASAHTSPTCEVDHPVIYTSVPAHMEWITRITGLKPG